MTPVIIGVSLLILVSLVILNGREGTCCATPSLAKNSLPPAQIAEVAHNAGFSGDALVTAVAIALAESGGDANAMGDEGLAPYNGPSIGLWQINVGSKAHPEWAGENLKDPNVNASKAFILYSRRGNFNDWSAFKSQQYTAFLTLAANAAAQSDPLEFAQCGPIGSCA